MIGVGAYGVNRTCNKTRVIDNKVGVVEQIDITQDRRHRSSDFMAHIRQKFRFASIGDIGKPTGFLGLDSPPLQ